MTLAVTARSLLTLATYRPLPMTDGTPEMHVLHLAIRGYRELWLPLEVEALPLVLLLESDELPVPLPLGDPTGLGMVLWSRLPPLATPLITFETATRGPTLVVELAHFRLLNLPMILEVTQLPTATTLLTWASADRLLAPVRCPLSIPVAEFLPVVLQVMVR